MSAPLFDPRLAAGALLVLGGARSGKSARAQRLAEASGLAPVLIATAEPLDAEMAARIARHRADRSSAWRTIEAPRALPEAIAEWTHPDHVVVTDCLTLWLTNIMLAGDDPETEGGRLEAVVQAARGPLILVSNEVGFGIVPETPLGRAFRDAQGRLNQRMAGACATVEFIIAGLPLVLK